MHIDIGEYLSCVGISKDVRMHIDIGEYFPALGY